MKKGELVCGVVKEMKFPNVGLVECEDGIIEVKNVIPGHKIEARVAKASHGRFKGRLQRTLEPSSFEKPEIACPHFGICGGCFMQTVPYEKQLEIKESMIRRLFYPVMGEEEFEAVYEGIKASPLASEYRNKMEFSFGNEVKDGELRLGMHKRGSFYDIVEVTGCQICDETFRVILKTTADFFREKGLDFFHKMAHTGYLRHLLVREGQMEGEYLIDLVTSTQIDSAYEEELLKEWCELILSKFDDDRIKGILHTKNDSLSDAVVDEGTDVLYGQNYFYESLLGLKFKVTPFSFFQTNSKGAEVLYSVAREYILGEDNKKLGEVFDLYSGTGTIAQVLSPSCEHVTGVEIVEEAVEAAKENAALNQLSNCDFIAGDVFKVLESLETKPDMIVLDPPRDGVQPKALKKIISYGVENMIYIACKPSSLARDIPTLVEAGYKVKRLSLVDMFPSTANVEMLCYLSK